MLKSLIKKTLRTYYKPRTFYKIPFGPNRGRYIEYDVSLNLDMMLGLHEPNTFEVARQIIHKGMVVVDIGANRGYFTIYFDQLVGDEGKVYAFEPVPNTFAALEKCCKRNNCQRTVLVQKAVAKENSEIAMFLGPSQYMSSVDAKWAGRAHGQITVESISLDTFFQSQDRGPDFIKMDIEGGGVFALPGMENLIKKYKPCLFLESHTPDEDKAIGHALSLAEYSVFRVGNKTPVKNLTTDYTDPYGIYASVVGIPRERRQIHEKINSRLFQRWRLGQRSCDLH